MLEIARRELLSGSSPSRRRSGAFSRLQHIKANYRIVVSRTCLNVNKFRVIFRGARRRRARRFNKINAIPKVSGGERGIRTLETVPRLHTFQACAFDHSAISPRGSPIIRLCGLCQGAWCKKAAKLSFEGIICRVRGVQALAVKQILKIRLRIPRSAMLLLTKPFEEIEVR